MADNKQFVKEIADMTVDFPQWYTDVVVKTQLVDYSPISFVYYPTQNCANNYWTPKQCLAYDGEKQRFFVEKVLTCPLPTVFQFLLERNFFLWLLVCFAFHLVHLQISCKVVTRLLYHKYYLNVSI